MSDIPTPRVEGWMVQSPASSFTVERLEFLRAWWLSQSRHYQPRHYNEHCNEMVALCELGLRAIKFERELSQARYETAMKCAEMCEPANHPLLAAAVATIRAYAESVKPVAVASTCSSSEGKPSPNGEVQRPTMKDGR